MRELDSETIPPDHWVETVRTRKEEGFDYLDFLSVRESDSGDFVVTVQLLDLLNGRHIRCEGTWTAQVDTAIPSLTDVFAGARWHELEASELFGINFVSSEGIAVSPAGAEHFIATEPGLRRDFALAPRLDHEWPGTNEPGLAPDHPRRKRKRAVPGNPTSWEPAND